MKITLKTSSKLLLLAAGTLVVTAAARADLVSKKAKGDLRSAAFKDATWEGVAGESLALLAQPAAVPMPKETTTAQIKVQSMHDDKWIAFRLKWADSEASGAGKLAEFSDAVALEFPVKNNEQPPSIMMGSKGDPAHIFHWRYQYQLDHEKGQPDIKTLYPNASMDMYPMEFADNGKLKKPTEEQRTKFAHGKAAGNPQAFPKSGVDEIMAEGFGTSAVIDAHESEGKGAWKNGEWTVVIVRALKREGGSVLSVGKKSNVAFAVWQGGKDEVGARKSLTMNWTPLKIEE